MRNTRDNLNRDINVKKFVRCSTFVLTSCFLSSCATNTPLQLEGATSRYKCLNPKILTVIAMHWDTCPVLGYKPSHATINQTWEVIPISTKENFSYYENQLAIQDKLNKEDRDCSHPSRISELLHLDKTTEIFVDEIAQYTNPSFSGISFKGSLNIKGKTYDVHYRGRLKRNDSILGYNFDDFFNTCN